MIVAGAAQRWWVAAHPIGTLSSDGAVIGLMARQVLQHGEFNAYMWGQAYGGGLEADLAAAVFAVAGSGTSQLLAATALSSALCSVALWWAGRVIVGERAAWIGALVFWVWPASALWRSLKPGGTYMAGLAVTLCAVGALARIREGDNSWRRCVIAGAWCGLAAWSSPMCLELLLPAALWCLPALRRLRWCLLGIVAGGVVGALPALLFGATNDWRNLSLPGGGGDLLTGIPYRLWEFVTVEAPIAMGVRVEGSLAWVGGPLGEVLAVAGAVALGVTAWLAVTGRAPRCRLPALTLALLPVLYSLNSLADRVGQGRYVFFAVSMGALLAGAGIERAAVSAHGRFANGRFPNGPLARRAGAAACAAGLAAACALGTAGLLTEPRQSLVAFPAPDVAMPTDDSVLLTLLADHHVTDAYATYWIAYRVMFESGGKTTVAPYGYDRYPLVNAVVAASPDPAYLFVSASRTLPAFETWCRGRHVRYQAWHLGKFTVVRPGSAVAPPALLNGLPVTGADRGRRRARRCGG
jgi:4-amino-4-deoxy-L-arabinose transferase-like glycosyltransferase